MIPLELAPYRERIKAMLSWMPDWITDRQFDELAFNWQATTYEPMSPDALMLPSAFGRSQYEDWVFLVQECCRRGLAKRKKRGETIYYIAAK